VNIPSFLDSSATSARTLSARTAAFYVRQTQLTFVWEHRTEELRTNLGSNFSTFLFPLCLLFWAQYLSPLRISNNTLPVLLLVLFRFLQSSLHVMPQTNVPNDRHESLPAKYDAENFLRVHETTLWRALFWTEFIILPSECFVRKCLVGYRYLFKALFGPWVIPVLIRMVLDSETAYKGENEMRDSMPCVQTYGTLS
jgi:hypothetical protein